ncbi:MAG: amino acid adenylation domain-containing protein [Planctomycetota bacterium]
MRQADSTPDAIAVVHGEVAVTYADLRRRASEFATRLRDVGVGPESRVAICMERTEELVVAIIGALQAEAAYVPIDPEYPANRIEFTLADSGADALVTAGLQIQRTERRRQSERVRRAKACRKRLDRCTAAGAAYVIYTSGSTGRPKGVVIEHRSAVALIDWAVQVYSADELRRVLASTSICFDLSIFELFVPLCCGGTVVLVDNALAENVLAEQAVTLINTVPSAAAELVRADAIPQSVKTVNLAGEPLSKQLVRDLYASDAASNQPTFSVYNLYGPSEDTTYSTFARMSADDSGTTSPIGRPISNTQAYILDEGLCEVPQGFPGELYLAGDGVARGYWNRPSLTAENFLPNPFEKSGAPMYRTGDRVRRRFDGELEFLGRTDNQIKLRGFRIELGEIEQALVQHPDVKETVASVVAAPGEKSSSQQLVAYVVGPPVHGTAQTLAPSSPEARDFREFLSGDLPHHMTPSQFVVLPQLPLLPNGKIDRRSLPEPQVAGGSSPALPTTKRERLLVDIWQQALGRDGIGVHDNFFALGGDSIIALQMFALARRRGMHFRPRDLFERPTISQLAAVKRKLNGGAAPAVDPTDVPLTPIQRWFFGLPLQHPHHWNQSLLLTVNEELDESALREAVRLLVREHPVLRASFSRVDGGWRQKWDSSPESPPLEIVRAATDDYKEVIRSTAEEIHGGFNLSEGPLWKIVYFELRGAESAWNEVDTAVQRRLLVVCHHLVVDGVSWRVLLFGLQRAYQQLVRTGRADMIPGGAPVSQWAARLSESDDFDAEDDYWRGVELAAERSTLPKDIPDGVNTMRTAKTIRSQISNTDTERLLTEVPDKYPVNIEELLVAAVTRTISKWAKTSDVALQLERHGRIDLGADLDLSQTVGWLTSLFPTVLPASDNEDSLQSIRLVKETLRKVPSGGVGYGVLRYCRPRSACERASPGNASNAAHHAPLHSAPLIRFNYLGQSDQLFTASGMFSPAREGAGPARHPDDPRDVLFEINAVISSGKLVTHWTYGSELHHAQTIHELASQLRKEVLLLIDACLRAESTGYSEADFPQMEFEPGELDDLLQRLE